MRVNKPNRRQRRNQPIDKIVIANQERRANRFFDNDLAQIERQIDRMASVRTLKYDEGAKARTAPSQASVILEAAPLNAHSEGIEETRTTHLIPRKSLTVKMHLAFVRPLMELTDDNKALAERPMKRYDLTDASRTELEAIEKSVMREHPKYRAQLAAKLYAAFKPTFHVGTDARQTWRSDSSLLDTHRLIGGTVKVKRQTANTRTFERDGEKELLPTWTDDDGNIVNPNTPTDPLDAEEL